MKIHFEGTKKELFRQLDFYFSNLDWKILDLSEISPQVGLKGSYSFDISVEGRIPHKRDRESDDIEDALYININNQLYGYDVPISRIKSYEEAFKILISYVEKENNIDLKDIMNKLMECKKFISDNDAEIEYYETHRLVKKY